MLKTRRILTGFCAILCCAVAVSGQVPGKDELISLYAKSLDLMQKAAFTSESNTTVIEPRVGERQNEFTRFNFFTGTANVWQARAFNVLHRNPAR